MPNYFAFQWHITEACDQRCKHCYIYANNPGKMPASMAWSKMQHVVDQCVAMCRKFDRMPEFYLTGGDPLLHPDFWRLVELLRDMNIPFTILGNPYHLDNDVCKRLKRNGCQRYQLSLDGMRSTHNWFRKHGAFDATLAAIPLLRRVGIETVLMSTVSGRNIEEIPDVLDIAVENKADVFAFTRYVPAKGEADNGIDPLDYRRLLDACNQRMSEYQRRGCSTWLDRKDHLWTLYAYEQGEFVIPDDAIPGVIYDGCNCGNCHLTILPDGDVLACRRVNGSRVGNVFKDTLSRLWLGPLERFREYEAFKKCGKCPLLAWCRGCPAVAKAVTGDFYGVDPQCWRKADA
ncbi:MAG: radical SAM/SPASM domain protein, ACGX system [Desulfovibrio sp.]|nr:radical SAM/SPASM domain protein, ACGX system [Desulfovibrio sp.]